MRLLTLFALLATLTAAVAGAAQADPDADPGRNLDVVLKPAAAGPADGLGKIRFRQPADADKIVYLETWVRLLPNSSYSLQRATDGMLTDGRCTGENWLTLGEGLAPKAIETNDKGTGRAMLFRDLAAVPEGTTLDIHFRVIDAAGAVVLESGCYQFTVRQ